MAYSFEDYSPDKPKLCDERRTIEFRQADASVDPDYIVAWIEVATSLMEWARNADVKTFQRGIRLVTKQAGNVEILLNVVGVSPRATKLIKKRAHVIEFGNIAQEDEEVAETEEVETRRLSEWGLL
ncbi:hypothetical protein BX600DRAFT_504520 [Xylariales sp. PMI_506]|nr:hypothetical protein BX600DRAFT_504520 [Xylariales sp. PMI_506]